MKIQNKHSGYTILVTLMIIGFLLVLTTGVLNLVLRELKDNKASGNYLKAFAGAEGALELALLDIKKNGYGFYNKIEDSKILRNDSSDKKEILISYDLNSKTKSYSGILKPFKQAVIPLFYIDDSGTHKIDNLELNILNISNFPNTSKMAYNIVTSSGDGIGGSGSINDLTEAQGRKGDGSFLEKTKINGNSNFLDSHSGAYLIVVNLDSSNNLEFGLSSTKEFTKPISDIMSSAKIMNYKQNLKTTLDNTEFLSILKYSLYSK